MEYRWIPIPLHHEGKLVLKSRAGLSFQVEIKEFSLGEVGTWQSLRERLQEGYVLTRFRLI